MKTDVPTHVAILLALAPALASCTHPPCELCGRWRSNAELTVQDMERSTVLSARQREFYRDGFFGRLTVEVRANETRAYFDDENPEDVAWEASTAVKQADGTYIERYMLEGREVTRTIRVNGDCYRIDQPELGFGEWFCRIE